MKASLPCYITCALASLASDLKPLQICFLTLRIRPVILRLTKDAIVSIWDIEADVPYLGGMWGQSDTPGRRGIGRGGAVWHSIWR